MALLEEWGRFPEVACFIICFDFIYRSTVFSPELFHFMVVEFRWLKIQDSELFGDAFVDGAENLCWWGPLVLHLYSEVIFPLSGRRAFISNYCGNRRCLLICVLLWTLWVVFWHILSSSHSLLVSQFHHWLWFSYPSDSFIFRICDCRFIRWIADQVRSEASLRSLLNLDCARSAVLV